MKKYLLFAATAAMMLASCSNEVDFTQSDVQQKSDTPTPIQFGTYLGKTGVTRAYSAGPITNDATGDNSLRTAEFGVFAYYTGSKNYRGYDTDNFDWTNASGNSWKKTETYKYPNFMYNQQITWGTSLSAWTYSPAKYWPNGEDGNTSGPSTTATQKEAGNLSFFAYAPYAATTSFTTDATSTSTPTGVTAKVASSGEGIIGMSTNVSQSNVWLKYKLHSGLESENVDLLWGTRGKSQYNLADGTDGTHTIGDVYNENLTKQKVDERVTFLFKHATAKIGGSEKNTESEATGPKRCGFKVVVDVDDNNAPYGTGNTGQKTYFSDDFSNTKTLVTIEWVKIQDGTTASSDTDNGLTSVTSNLANTGWFNIEEGKWESVAVDGTPITYAIQATNGTKDTSSRKYEINSDIKEPTDNTTGIATSGSEGSKQWGISGLSGVVASQTKDLFSNSDDVPALQLIPGGTQDIYISVKYWVRTVDEKLQKGFTEVSQVITNKVSFNSLDPNKYYTIVMHLGLTSVKFEAKVADWATTSNGTYDSDGNYTEGTTKLEESVWLPSNVVTTSTP